MSQYIVSPEFEYKVSMGKYSRWATHFEVNPNTLEALLWAVGEYGTRFNSWQASQTATGKFLDSCCSIGCCPRSREALLELAAIQSGKRGKRLNSPMSEESSSAQQEVFSPKYQQRLSQGTHTAWAAHLNESSLRSVLWMVGEYALRAPAHEKVKCGDEHERVMRAALRVISTIHDGHPMVLGDARGFIQTEDETLLQRKSLLVEQPSANLIDAAGIGDLARIEDCLNSQARIHTQKDLALRRAASRGHLPVVERLLTAGADVHAEDDHALRFAAGNGELEMVECLLAAGADVHARDEEALYWAADNRYLPVLQRLLTVALNGPCDRENALTWAHSTSNAKLVQALEKLPASVFDSPASQA